MKKMGIFIGFVMLFQISVITELVPNTQEIKKVQASTINAIDTWMPDKQLQIGISQQLGIPVENLTQNDMLKLTTINFSTLVSKGITSLKGLEYAKNLAGDLDLNYNSISDISPLFSTKISYLRLAGNNLSEVSQFLNMPYLKTLVVPRNHIRDLSPLKGSQYTTILAQEQEIILDTQTVNPFDKVNVLAQVNRPNAEKISSFTLVQGTNFSYDLGTDQLSWQLTGSTAQTTLKAEWNDKTWIRANYNALNSSEAGFSGIITQPLNYKTPAGDINIKYIDELGNEIHSQQKISGNVGETYDASISTYQLAIDGYRLDSSKLPSNAKGKFLNQPQEVVYHYLKNGSTITNPSVPPHVISPEVEHPDSEVEQEEAVKQPEKQEQQSKNYKTESVKSSALNTSRKGDRDEALPSAGEKENRWISVLGGLLLSTAAFVIFKKR